MIVKRYDAAVSFSVEGATKAALDELAEEYVGVSQAEAGRRALEFGLPAARTYFEGEADAGRISRRPAAA